MDTSDRLAYDIIDRDGFGITTIIISDKVEPFRIYPIRIDTVQEESFLSGRIKGRYIRRNLNDIESILIEDTLI